MSQCLDTENPHKKKDFSKQKNWDYYSVLHNGYCMPGNKGPGSIPGDPA